MRQQAQVGVLADAFGDEAFCRALVAAIGAGEELQAAHGTLRFRPTRAFADDRGIRLRRTLRIALPAAQSSNTIVVLGERLFLKAYRRLQAGVNPEVEIGRFLTEVAHFPNCVPVAGSVEYATTDGRTTTLALLQGYVDNQGDGWEYTVNYLDGSSNESPTQTNAAATAADVHGGYLALVRTLGLRTAELHAAFARNTGDPAFDPEPVAARGRRRLDATRARRSRRSRSTCSSAVAATLAGGSGRRCAPGACAASEASGADRRARRGSRRRRAERGCTATITSVRCCSCRTTS